jgi:hypothetical protein
VSNTAINLKETVCKCLVDITKVTDVKQPVTANLEFINGIKNDAEFIINAPKNPIESGNYYKVTVVIDGVERTIEGVYTGTVKPR